MRKIGKRGVSPVIATVLLIALVIIIAIIIFLFMRNIGGESISKFGDENIKLACQNKVKFEASYLNGKLAISNIGEAPIFSINIRIMTAGGNYETKEINKIPEWPSSGLLDGGAVSVPLQLDSNTEKIVLTPVLVGTVKDGGKRTYVCEEYSITETI